MTAGPSAAVMALTSPTPWPNKAAQTNTIMRRVVVALRYSPCISSLIGEAHANTVGEVLPGCLSRRRLRLI